MNQVRCGFFSGRRYQYGNGLFYSGARYQKGNGFFGRILKSAVWPLLKYIGKQGLKTAIAIGGEAARNPNNFKEIAKQKLREVGLEAIDHGAERVKQFVQTGNGVSEKSLKGIKRSGSATDFQSKRKYGWLSNT